MKKIYFLLLNIVLCVPVSIAQDYDAILRTIFSNNPEVAAMNAANDSELLSLKSENNIPDPELEFEYHLGQNGIGNKWAMGISQRVEWPGIYHTRSKSIKYESEALKFLNKSNYNDKLLEIKLLLIDIVKVNKEISLMKSILGHMSQLKVKYQDAYQAGETSLLDVNKIEIEHIAISRKLNALKIQKRVLYGSLTALNGGKECSNLMSELKEYPQDRLLSEDEYAKQINDNDPLLSYNTLMTEAQSLKVKAAKFGGFPELSLGYVHTNELGAHFNGLKIGISLPFFSNRHKVQAAELLQKSYNKQSVAIHASKMSIMYGDRANVLSLREEIDAYSPIFDGGNNMELLKKAFNGGELSLLDYLQELNYFLASYQDYMDVVYQYHYTLAKLNRYIIM